MDFQLHMEKYRKTITQDKGRKMERALLSQKLINIVEDVSLETGVGGICKIPVKREKSNEAAFSLWGLTACSKDVKIKDIKTNLFQIVDPLLPSRADLCFIDFDLFLQFSSTSVYSGSVPEANQGPHGDHELCAVVVGHSHPSAKAALVPGCFCSTSLSCYNKHS